MANIAVRIVAAIPILTIGTFITKSITLLSLLSITRFNNFAVMVDKNNELPNKNRNKERAVRCFSKM